LAFVLGMFLTPPDFISQTLLAVPIYLLYEIGIVMSKIFVLKRDEAEEEAEAAS
jgi:sec-independent protein translocase protein TatC